MTLLAKTAMVLSLAYYTLIFGYVWLGQMLGVHNDIWEMFDFPPQASSPPGWTLLICLLVTLVALLSLGWAYRGAWRILAGGIGQDFRALAANMRGLAWGLIGFWIGYNVLAAVLPHLIVIGLRSTDRFEFGWDPLDLDIVFFIVGIVILAISRTLERAWMAEDENKHFL